jgi:hypothetical protein
MNIPGGHFVSACCTGVKCRCGDPASHKVEEAIFVDDPSQDKSLGRIERAMLQRHPFTQYVCCKCFRALMGPAVACEVTEEE